MADRGNRVGQVEIAERDETVADVAAEDEESAAALRDLLQSRSAGGRVVVVEARVDEPAERVRPHDERDSGK